ncbi:MAG: protein kinase domain-containing protein [Myxococcaceae bacterium]
MRSADKDDLVGRLVAQKYRVEQLIGEGGMGKVYRATQVALEKPVVLKVLRKSLLSDERTKARFQREAKAASRLNHPNSISILDFGEAEEGALYIAMEFVAGKDLQQILAREWPLPEARIARIVSQVLSALSEAHQAGVIHRDLKPENIMVEPRRGGETDFVKVLDFGIAKIQDARDDGPALTRAGFVCGTPEYMSPEQARGAVLDARSDLYAVGVILYQLCAGVLPFESDSAVGFATKHLNDKPIPPTQRRPEAKISPAMERLILRTLSKDPADRPQTADAFKAELAAFERERRQAMVQERSGGQGLGRSLSKRATSGEDTQTQMTDPGWSDHAEATMGSGQDVTRRLGVGSRPLRPDGTRSKWTLYAGVVGAVVLVAVGATVALRQTRPAETAVAVKVPVLPGYLVATPPERWDATAAAERSLRADAEQQKGEHAQAARLYEEAFALMPDPEYSLKLGELHRLKGDPETARGWWSRHLRDRPDSRARRYITTHFPNVAETVPTSARSR